MSNGFLYGINSSISFLNKNKLQGISHDKKIHRFYRIIIKLKTLTQEDIIGCKCFFFPARPKAMIRYTKSYMHRFDGNQVFDEERAI